MAMFSTLSPHWTLAAGTSGSTLLTTIIVFGLLVVAGLAAAWTLKKD